MFKVVIPARYASTRLPGKPLCEIAGVPMIVRVARQAAASQTDEVIVATDDARVKTAVEQAGFQCLLTAVDHPSGSDRVNEVCQSLGWADDTVVINVQGDEPLIPPQVIDQLAKYLLAESSVGAITLCESLSNIELLDSPHVVKVVRTATNKALYFSRSIIPFTRDTTPEKANFVWKRHIGVYGFRVATLKKFVALPISQLEAMESLEQLRMLENDIGITVLNSIQPVPGGVDTPQDRERVEQAILRDIGATP